MKKLFLLFILLLATLFLLTSCGQKQNDNLSLPKQVNIGYLRVPNDELIALQKDYIKKYFDSLGVRCNFAIVDSGVEANQAFASKSLDFASMGHTNGVVSLARGLDTQLVWIHELIGASEGLVVRNSNSISDISQLVGKKIATTFSSTSHYILLNLLKEYGIADQVQLIDMQTRDIVAAWKRGDIDVAYTWEPSLSACAEDGGSILIDSSQMVPKGFITANIGLARKEFLNAYPELVANLLYNISRGSQLYADNKQEAIQIAAKGLDIDQSLAEKQMEGSIWLSLEDICSDRLLGNMEHRGDFARVFKNTADFLLQQGSIDKEISQEEIDAFINPQAAMRAKEILDEQHAE